MDVEKMTNDEFQIPKEIRMTKPESLRHRGPGVQPFGFRKFFGHSSFVIRHSLVWCLAIDWCFAARNFRFPRGASDEHTLQRSVRSEQRSGRRKGLRPGGLRRKRPGASLLLADRALRLCSLVAPCPRPFWAQRNTSQLRDTTLARAPVLLTQQMLDHHLIEVLIVAFRNQLLGFPFVECA